MSAAERERAMADTYDEIAYPSNVVRQTHPDRLAAHAALFGLSPAAPASARVLEIGAGDGSNLIPMAFGAPQGRFVGFDLAGEPVRRGNAMIEALGLRNIRLFQADVCDVDLGGEAFDYVIALGFWSWAPVDAREALMRVIGERLAPHGVAFASFNVLPGGHLRRAIRDELLFAARGAPDFAARVQAGYHALQAWPPPSPEQTAFRRAMAEEAARLKTYPMGGIAHDELNPFYHSALLVDFAAQAARFGLRILAGAGQGEVAEWIAPPGAPDGPETEAALLDRAQQADFAMTRFYREPLLVRAEAPVVRRPRGEFVARLHVASRAPRVPDPHLAGVLEKLAPLWPRTVPAASLGLDEDRLLDLVRLHEAGVMELRGGPSRFLIEAGDRPTASPYARLQASRGATDLATLLHTVLAVDAVFTRDFIVSLDGTRTVGEIVQDIAPRLKLTEDDASRRLREFLDFLGRAPLLVG
jgi:SAM-dependent methyltransferase